MLTKIKVFFKWLGGWIASFWKKEEPKVAGAISGVPADAKKAYGWLASFTAGMKSFGTIITTFSTWYWLAKAAFFVVVIPTTTYFYAHAKGAAPIPAIQADARANATKAADALAQASGLKVTVGSLQKEVASDKATITLLNQQLAGKEGVASAPKTSSHTGTTSKKKVTPSPWYSGILGNN